MKISSTPKSFNFDGFFIYLIT